MSDYHGHATLEDGTHVPLTKDEADALSEASEEAAAKSAADMPETRDALRVMQRGLSRLRELGWREAKYCPEGWNILCCDRIRQHWNFRGLLQRGMA